MKKHVLILGGGLSGLSAAEVLSDFHDVTLVEKDEVLGGLASSFEMNGEQIPKYYHHVIESNKITQKFLRRFNLLRGAKWKPIKVLIGVNKKLNEITNPFGLMNFSYLSFWGKLRFGFFGLYTIFIMNPKKISDDRDAYSWLLERAGKEVTKKIFHNLYARNKFNTSLKKISAKQFANRLKEREVYDKFTFPPKGLQGMIDGLEKSIIRKGGKILKNCPVAHIDFNSKKVSTQKGDFSADIIINTLPIPYVLQISKGLPEDYVSRLSKIKYCPSVGLTFGTKNFLNKEYYWINLFRERIHVIMQHSVLIDKYKDKVSWCIRYGGSEEDLEKTDSEIIRLYSDVIRKYFPKVKFTWVKVFRDKYAEPVYDIDYHKYAPNYRTPVPFVYMAGIQVTFPKIRNMNVALESGLKVAKIVLEDN